MRRTNFYQWCVMGGLLLSSAAMPSFSADTVTATSRDTTCSSSAARLEIAVGWSLEEAKQRSPSLGTPETPGFNVGLSSYVYKPAFVRYVGGVPFEVSCPHMVSATPRKGRIAQVEIELVADDPLNLDAAFQLIDVWRSRFDAMHLAAPSREDAKGLESFEMVRRYLANESFRGDGPVGWPVAAWQHGVEDISIDIERWNFAPLNQPPKYMYIVEIIVSDEDLFREDKATIKAAGGF